MVHPALRCGLCHHTEPALRQVQCVNRTSVCMQALKEVYLPESGVWIAKYPFVDRDVFLDISLDIERERKSQE